MSVVRSPDGGVTAWVEQMLMITAQRTGGTGIAEEIEGARGLPEWRAVYNVLDVINIGAAVHLEASA